MRQEEGVGVQSGAYGSDQCGLCSMAPAGAHEPGVEQLLASAALETTSKRPTHPYLHPSQASTSTLT